MSNAHSDRRERRSVWDVRAVILIAQTILIDILLLCYAGTGLVFGDEQALERVWLVVQFGFYFLLAYAGGSSVLQVLRRVRLG